MTSSGPRSDRGQSVTAFVAVVMVALLAVAGLVVDGGRRAAATREAQVTAQAAARAGADAAVSARLAGMDGSGPGLAAARRHLQTAGVSGTASVVPGGIRVDTSTTVSTVFLGVVGISTLTARGSATAEIRPQR